jgi:hypothetical protein
MAIRAKRLPEYGVTVVVWSGRLTVDEVRRHIGGLGAVCTDANRWVQYWDRTADLSGLGVAVIPELKRLIAAKLKELYGDKHAVSAVVRAPAMHDPFPEFWPSYASADQAYPAEVAAFPSLEAACAWLNLSEDGRRAVIDVVEGSSHPSRENGNPGSSADAKL